MNRKLFIGLGLAILMMVLVIGTGAAQEPGNPLPPDGDQQTASERIPMDALAVTEALTSTFSYQGVLKEDGEPVTGNREMTFRLYTDDACTMMVGDEYTYTVPVNQGLFAINLLVNHAEFNGQALWLETEVNSIAVGCQAIQAVPYAMGLRPGAVISGTVPGAASIVAVNTGSDGRAVVGLVGEGTEEDIHPGASFYNAGGEFVGPNGVIGAASSEHDDGYGVIGLAQGANGRGIFGQASSASGSAYGVYGESNAFSGSGVYGKSNATQGPTHGVYGGNFSQDGYGVYGYAQAITGTTYGVYGKSNSPYGAGGYFANTGDSAGIDLVVGGGVSDDGIIASDPDSSGSDLFLDSNDEVWVRLDRNDDEDGNFEVQNGEENTVFRVDEDGNTSQTRTGDGLVKAAVTLYCSNSTSYIMRSFNNVNGSTILVTSGADPGLCSVDFGFQISDRYWSATAVYDTPRFVTCDIGATNNTLDCYRSAADGTGIGGTIIIVIY